MAEILMAMVLEISRSVPVRPMEHVESGAVSSV